MIKIRKSPTADTRTCDFSKVDIETLKRSSFSHMKDVDAGMRLFAALLQDAAERHDYDKIKDIDGFHRDFITGFKNTTWWDNHRKINRHHLQQTDGVPEDVNLADVIEMIVDCVMAGMARTGTVTPITIDPEVLMRAFHNSVSLLMNHVVVCKSDKDAICTCEVDRYDHIRNQVVLTVSDNCPVHNLED